LIASARRPYLTAVHSNGDAVVVLGIDPGTAVTGYGVVTRTRTGSVTLRECGVIKTSAARPLLERIRDLYDATAALIERHAPMAVSVEDVFQGKNAQSALKLGHARGAILLAAAHASVEVAEYAPREIKKAVVGNGNATKDQVGFMVQQQLRLASAPAPADAADGVAAALCHCMIGRFPS
jgi:crossover junction endodeoxyribonuclease RuvC